MVPLLLIFDSAAPWSPVIKRILYPPVVSRGQTLSSQGAYWLEIISACSERVWLSAYTFFVLKYTGFVYICWLVLKWTSKTHEEAIYVCWRLSDTSSHSTSQIHKNAIASTIDKASCMLRAILSSSFALAETFCVSTAGCKLQYLE